MSIMKFSIFKISKFLLIGILLVGASLVIGHWSSIVKVARAQECPSTDYQCQIDAIQRSIDALSPAQQKNKEDLAGLLISSLPI